MSRDSKRPEPGDILDIDAALRSTVEKERWAAAEAAGQLVSDRPRAVWNLVVAHGASEIEDVRSAVATCMLEHLLEEHFEEYFPLLEREIRAGNIMLGDTLRRCWKLGQAELGANADRWDKLVSFSL
jgi:hypothetical protein